MDFDVTDPLGCADLNSGIEEVGSGVGIRSPGMENEHGLAGNRLEIPVVVLTSEPDVVHQRLRQLLDTHSPRVGWLRMQYRGCPRFGRRHETLALEHVWKRGNVS